MHFYSLFNSWQSAKKCLAAAISILLFSCSFAAAQSDRYGASIGADYDAPVGNFSYTFKPAINYNLNLFHQYGDFTGSISFGYHVYKPKVDTFYYQVSNTDYGTVAYQSFPVYSAYLGGTYNLTITDQFKLYAGINLGIYYTHLAYHSSDFLQDNHVDLNEEDLYFAPRLGLTYMLSDDVGIGLEGKYNFFAPTGDKRYNERVGTLYNSYSAGFRLTYLF